MDVSRVFVKGLPPSIDEVDFKRHFSKRHVVTDFKLFPKRRIGYVGFKSAADAESAVRYFNKTFYRMSRLHVELARGVSMDYNESFALPLTRTMKAASPTTFKRKRSSEQIAMNNSSRVSRGTTQLQNYQNIDPSNVEQTNTAKDSTSDTNVDDATNSGTPAPDEQDNDKNSGVRLVNDDTDWVRARTSRLLGLVDDDAENERGDHASPNTQERSANTSSAASTHERVTAADADGEPELGTLESSSSLVPGGDADDTTQVHDDSLTSSRLFVRNLSYDVKEEEIESLFSAGGKLQEVTVPHDFRSGKAKGFAFLEFSRLDDAVKAMQQYNGTIFQGRLLHVLPASERREHGVDEFTLARLPTKKRRIVERKQQASSSFNWNALYMNTDTILSSTASRLGINKSELIDPTSTDAAVRQAHAETTVIEEVKDYFQAAGVNLESFGERFRNRDGRALLIKNFKYGTSAEDLKKLLVDVSHPQVNVVRVLIPPGGTIALVELANETQAEAAMRQMAYRKLDDMVLFVERAPRDVFNSASHTGPSDSPKQSRVPGFDEQRQSSTVFVTNLDFSTTSERLQREFDTLEGFMSATVKTKQNPRDATKPLSMGFGFVEFSNVQQADAAIAGMNGHVLDGHALQLRASRPKDPAAETLRQDQQRKRDRVAKVVIKNLPFEASKKDLHGLFRPYGQIRALRMPKKLNNNTRGYAFAQFKTPKEAENAVTALRNTHLLGRRLVLEFAEEDLEGPEQQIEKMQQRAKQQSTKIASGGYSTARQKLSLASSANADAE